MIVSDTRGTTHLAKQIRTLREAKGMSLAFFAKALGVTEARAAKFEDPAFDGWTAQALRNVARVLDMHLDARFIAPAWDCYSPVALVLWAAADEVERGNTGAPLSCGQSRAGDFGGDVFAFALDLSWQARTALNHGDNAGAVLAFRQFAEFGPAGRPHV